MTCERTVHKCSMVITHIISSFSGTDHQQVQSVVTTEFPDKDPKNSKTEVDSHKEVLHLDGVFEKVFVIERN